MRWSRLALYSLYSVLALLVVVLVTAFTIDFGRFKGNAETLVSDLLQRQFVIEGPLHLTLGSRIELSAEGVRLAGTEWSSDADLARVGKIEASVDTWSLISWPIMVETLQVDGIRVNLEHDETGANNWTFFAPTEKVEKERTKRFRLPVMLQSGEITDSRLSYNKPGREQPFRITLDELTESITDESDQVSVDLAGDINGTPMSLAATAAGVEDLINLADLQFTIDGNLGEITFDGNAEIADLLRPSRPTATLNLHGPNIEYLTDVLHLPRITSGPLELSTEVAPVGDSMQLNLDGKFGEFVVLSDGRFVNLQELQDIELRVSASGPDAGTIARVFGAENVPKDPFNIMGVIQRSGPAVTVEDITVTIGESQFSLKAHFADFPRPLGANAEVRVNGPDVGRFTRLFGLPGRIDGPFRLDADLVPLNAGGATVDLVLTAKDLTLTVDGNVTDDPNLVGTELQVRYSGENLRTVTDALNIAAAPADPFDLHVNLARISEGAALQGGSLTLGENILTFNGLVGNKPLEADTNVSFELLGPNLAKTLVDFGLDADELPYARYKVTGSVSREIDRFVLQDILASLGDNLEYHLTADGVITDAPQLLGTRLRVGAKGASLGAITDAVGVEGIPNLPFDAAATVELRSEGYIVEAGRAQLGDTHATLSGLVGRQPLASDTDLTFGITAPQLKSTLAQFGVEVAQLPEGDLVASGGIRSRGNYFALDGISASLAGATAEVSGRLGAFPELDGTDVNLRVSGADLSALLPDKEALRALDKRFELTTSLQLDDQRLRVSQLDFEIDETKLSAVTELTLEPIMDSGRLTVTASSPDVFVLSPQFAEMAVPDKAPMDLDVTLDWADQRWNIESANLKLGTGQLISSGTVDGPPDFDHTDLKFDWTISSLNNFSPLAGRELPDEAAHLKFHMVGEDGVVTLDGFDGVVGNSDIRGDFSLHYGDIPQIDVALTSNRLDLAPFQPPEATAAPQQESPEPAPARRDRDRKVIPDTPVPVDELQKFLANVEVRVGEINLRNRNLRNLALDGSVADGILTVQHFNLANEEGGELNGRFAVRPLDSGAEIGMRLNGSNLRMGLPAKSEDEALALPNYDLVLAFITTGSTVRELAGNANGFLRLTGGEGRIRAGALRFLTQDFLFQLLSTVNPFAVNDPYSNLKCTAVLATIEDGQLHGKPVMVIESDKINIFANADVDLKTEKLLAEFNTVPQKGLGISLSGLVNPYVNVTGTLGNPIIGLDPESVILEGGVAVATAGISILAKSFKDRFLSSRNPCGDAIKDADEAFRALREKYGRAGTVTQN